MSSNYDIEEKIKKIVASRLKDKEKIEGLDYDTPLLSLGIDSILALSILVEIEDEFNVEINDGDLNMDRIKNISNFSDLVRSYN
ncbi:acyl carrier protein [Alkaliphilus peptidifermentans]|uniref:Acyl carrier protein n=1 Tax=Alkaliphilus peptidifermentans DSM 18978 TaxID=1120976 RepID=A0A1G5K7N1_9FIRM|nr:acyl carrier protein [Alkaliphilus peptidifermentans]SCY95939.1 acyl carrier protein [Alkaliphilus peptidifermentans DSM 18978]